MHARPEDIDTSTPFLEMGADSLVMVDVMQGIESEYGVKLAIRNFFEDLLTLNALATHIDGVLPAPAAKAAAVAAPAAMPGPVSTDGEGMLERVFAEQNRMVQQLIAQQMEVLRQMGGTPSAPPAAKPAAAPVSVPANAPLLPWGTPAPARGRGMSEAQQQHLEALAARYTSRTRRSKEMVQASRQVLADSRATVGFRFSTKEMLYPIVGERTLGSKLWDVDGNEYVDFTMGFGVHLFGHQPESHTIRN